MYLKTIFSLLLIFVASSLHAQEPDSSHFHMQTQDIRFRLKSSHKFAKVGEEALIGLMQIEFSHENIFVKDNVLSSNPLTQSPVKTNVLARAMNVILNKYIDSLFVTNEHDFIVIPLLRFEGLKTDLACIALLKNNILENEVVLRVNDLFRAHLIADSIIHPSDKINNSMLLSDLFVSGFSLNQLLNNILDELNEEFDLNPDKISLLEASNLSSVKDCTDLIKEKAKLPNASPMNPTAKWILTYIPNYFTTAKSNDEIIKPRSNRSPVSYSFTNSPESKLLDAYYGLNMVGFINRFELISMFLGPVGERHLYEVSGKDSVNKESWGVAVGLTELIPQFLNLRLKEFGVYFIRRNDYKKLTKSTEIKGSFTFSFEPRNWIRFVLPRYEPIGYRCKCLTKDKIELFSYQWFPTFDYDFIRQENTDTNKFNPLTYTLNSTVYLLQRVIEFDGSWKFKLIVNNNDARQLTDYNVFREFAVKLNIVDIKSAIFKPVVKDFKFSFGFDYQDGINITTGTNQVIRSLVFGFGF